MTYPASVTTVTVTGRWRYADGSAAIPTGYVTFTPNATLQVPADGDTLPARPLRAVLDAQGEISVTLMSTADPDVEPTGWAYLVAEHVGPPRQQQEHVRHETGLLLHLQNPRPHIVGDGVE